MFSADIRDVFRHARTYNRKNTDEFKLHIPTHLSSALKTSLQLGLLKKSGQILHFLMEHGQCSRQFAWQVLMVLYIRNSRQESLEFAELAGVFSKFPSFPTLEVNAVMIFNMIRKGQYEQAYDEISRCEGLVHSDSSTKYGMLAAMLLFYKFILQLYMTNFESQDQADHQMAIEILMSKSYLLPLIAEMCIVSLARLNDHSRKIKLNDKAKVEKFIYRYIEAESNGGWGVCGQEHTLAILNAHSFRVSENVKFNILEEISQRDPGNAKVLELCKMHLIMDQRQKKRSVKHESDIGTESEMSDIDESSDSDNIIMCLELLFNFLDCYLRKQVTPPVREAWSLLADVLRRICIKGGHSCFKKLTKLWHRDRKDWWTHFRDLKGDTVDEVVRNKALVCYLLESDAHPFVRKSQILKNSNHLRSLIKQFQPSKRRMDEIVKSLSETKQCLPQKLVSTPPKDTPQTGSKLDSFLSKYQHLDSQKIAEGFFYHMTSQPLGSKMRKREASALPNTLDLYGLPISDRLTKRYEFRRSSTPRSWYSSDSSDESLSSASAPSKSEERTPVQEELERGVTLSSPPVNEDVIPNAAPIISNSDTAVREASVEDSSEGEFIPSDDDDESAVFSMKLRSWCKNEGATCYDIQILSQRFIENYEKFKAKEFASQSQESAKLSRLREFVLEGIWEDMTVFVSSSSSSSLDDSDSESNTHRSAAHDILSPMMSYMETSNAERRLLNTSAQSACSSVTDYPNSMDRVLRRLQRDFDESVSFNGRLDDAEYVVEAYVDEPQSSPKEDQREVVSPDMFTDYESEVSRLMSPSSSPAVCLQGSVAENIECLNAEERKMNIDSDSSKMKFEKMKNSLASQTKHSAAQSIERTKEKTIEDSRVARKKSKKRRTSSSEPKEGDERKPPKRKRLQRSWAVGETLTAKPRPPSSAQQSTNIIQPTFGIRKKKSSKQVKANVSSASSRNLSKEPILPLVNDSPAPVSVPRRQEFLEVNQQGTLMRKNKSKSKHLSTERPKVLPNEEHTVEKEIPVEVAGPTRKTKSSSKKSKISTCDTDLQDWSVDLVEKILSERKEPK